MSEFDASSIKLVTEKLDTDNFSSWRWGIITALGYKNLDDYVLSEHTTDMKASPDYRQKRKQVTNFIRMHLSHSNLERFVPDIGEYNPKELWDKIIAHFAAKTVENSANALDKLFDIQFIEGDMQKSVNNFRTAFRRVVEVSSKFDKKSLEAVAVVFALKRLPMSFSVFRQLQFASFKDDNIDFNDFLQHLEVELRRQDEAAIQLAASSKALAVAQSLGGDTSSTSNSKKKGRRPYCSNQTHNPEASHSVEDCWQLHPEKAIAFHKAAMDRFIARTGPRASLSLEFNLHDTIILDSGASSHFLKHKAYFSSLSSTTSSVFGANGAAIPILGFGPATIPTAAGPLHLSLAYYSPTLSNSLISQAHFLRLGYSILPTAGGKRYECRKGTQVLCSGPTTDNLLFIDMNHLSALSIKSSNPLDLHRALGHPSLPYLKRAYPDLHLKHLACPDCDLAKMHRLPFQGSFPTFQAALDCIHMDLCGPITPASKGGNRYFLKILDGHTKYRFIFPMRCKSDTFHHFEAFLNQAETSSGRKLKRVVSDNGGEFCNHRFVEFFRGRGIQHITSAPYTPQQNPFAERGNRTTIEKARALLSTSGLSLDWWGEAVQLSVFLENRSPDSSLDYATPYEKWHGSKPDLSRLVPFGCRAVVYQSRKDSGSKMAPPGIEGIFINYDGHHHSYKIWIPDSDKLVITHHVLFTPSVFPQKSVTLQESSPPFINFNIIDEDIVAPERELPEISDDGEPIQEAGLSSPSPQPSPPPSPAPPIASNKKGYAYVPHFDKAPNNISSSIDPANIIEGSRRHRAMVIVGEPSSTKDPKNYGEILGRIDENEWLMAIEVELGNMKRHEVWVVAPKTPGTRELDTVWVFKRKFDADGELLKYKARLCVRGFRQIEGIDYNSTFAPTGRLATLRTILGIAAVLDFDIQQMDVKCAFLNGVPEEDLFIKVPDGLGIDLPPGHGLKLQRSLYGLKQSPRCWYKALKGFFESINFKPSTVDPCLFIHSDIARPCFVFVHVDDLVIVGPDVNFLKDSIKGRFEMDDLGPCQYVLGMRVTRNRSAKTLMLSQDRYCREILEEFNLLDCKSASCPLPPNATTIPVKDQPVDSSFNYRRGVGLLQYLVQCTRPDLAFAVSFLSQFLNNPSKTHQELLTHTLRYVQYSKNFALTLGLVNSNPHRLIAHADASYATATHADSFAGSTVLFNGLVGWRCHKQNVDDAPALSTTEAEYRACSEAGQDIRWLDQLLSEIYPSLNIPLGQIILYCDNQGALALLKNSIYQHRTRHINVRHHWLRHHIEQANNFQAEYVRTEDNLADFLTKPLSPKPTRLALVKVGLGDMSA